MPPGRFRRRRTCAGKAVNPVGWLSRAAAGTLLLLVTTCAPIVERAPFSVRPDTLSAGDLLGPFEGTVVDAETDHPIAGAVVEGAWAFERGLGLTGPAGASESVTETGADGHYSLPALATLPTGASMRIRRFTLVVYQRGYIGWRSDSRFPEGSIRHDFSQRGNKVRLEKWRDGLAHTDHLVFLGGGSAVKAAYAAEVQAAVLELEGHRPIGVVGLTPEGTNTRVVPLDAGPLLSEDEVRGVTGYAGEFDLEPLKDLPTTEFYDSRHFKARGQTEAYDVGLRVWRLGPDGADVQYRKLLGQLPGAVPKDEVGDSSLRARTSDILGVAFLAHDRGVVVSISCGVRTCSEISQVVRLAKLVESHLGDMAGSGVQKAATPALSAPAAPGQSPDGGPANAGTDAGGQP